MLTFQSFHPSRESIKISLSPFQVAATKISINPRAPGLSRKTRTPAAIRTGTTGGEGWIETRRGVAEPWINPFWQPIISKTAPPPPQLSSPAALPLPTTPPPFPTANCPPRFNITRGGRWRDEGRTWLIRRQDVPKRAMETAPRFACILWHLHRAWGEGCSVEGRDVYADSRGDGREMHRVDFWRFHRFPFCFINDPRSRRAAVDARPRYRERSIIL